MTAQPLTPPEQPGTAGGIPIRPLVVIARLANCGQCWQPPGDPCRPEGSHLARYIRAERRGLIPRAVLARLTEALETFAPDIVVPDSVAAQIPPFMHQEPLPGLGDLVQRLPGRD